MGQMRIQRKVRLPRHHDEALSLDPRDPDVLRAKHLPLLESKRSVPIKRVS